ncbi:alginate O-acetyltransferase complex protein AlgI [Dysgonomonadaceae bacterium PH5-43]|nr:alginate O-acetyltransferase complex protein AlgI [Dysgonomonadaceae bacterium PH5-43]
MIFNSLSFGFFFAIILLCCIALQALPSDNKVKFRNLILLLSSYYFYAFLKWEFVILLLVTTLINYVSAIKIDKYKLSNNIKTKYWLWIAVVGSLCILGYFKYVNFFIGSVNDALEVLGISVKLGLLKIILPVGISFFTFQALTYTLDVYKGKMLITKSFTDYALFVSFFPTILSGPIERARNLLPQIQSPTKINLECLIEGGKRFLWGAFKKMVIADRLAVYINMVYASNPEHHSSYTLIVVAIFYSFQIYADFSGYSDMAIGVARAMGFKLNENFKYPYFSTSIKEFWKRWHISLTSWFTEYVYIPLGGNRVSEYRWIFNISSVFLLSGLWHGANWSFILWGALHAIYYLAEYYWKKTNVYILLDRKNTIYSILRNIFSTLIVITLVSIAWVFFRIEDIEKAYGVVMGMFNQSGVFIWGSSAFTTALTLLLLIAFIGLDWIKYKEVKFNPYMSAIGYACLLAMIQLFGVSDGGFVYFQF